MRGYTTEAAWVCDTVLRHTGAMTTEDLVAVAKRFRSTERSLERLREELIATLRATFAEPGNKLSKSEAARITGYTREHVTRLLAEEQPDS
jgi:hypothetical protein